jgi:hypothetical protein
MESFDLNKLIVISEEIRRKDLENIREAFRELGADYDRWDVLIINENLFPELKMFKLYNEQIKLSKYLPDDCPGIIFYDSTLKRGLYENCNFNEW